jgi:3-methyladenine DNA glycosylase AlkD
MNPHDIKKRLRLLADKEKAKVLQGFFKTGPGQYGEGDVFLGITVPALRRLARECRDTSVAEAALLLQSAIHEERLLALLLFVRMYGEGDDRVKGQIYKLYLKSMRYVNNWDLVDLSAPNIVGNYLLARNRRTLYALAKSRDLWKRRIAILATFAFIRQGDYADTLKISALLLTDDHDLIHKAVGWMLREVGKRSLSAEERFLKRHYKNMPRTMLRYAIERFPEGKRRQYLNGNI